MGPLRNVLPEPPDVPVMAVDALPPGDPVGEETSVVEGPPDVEPLPPGVEVLPPELPPPGVEVLETRAGPPEEPPLEPDVGVREVVSEPPERRVRSSSISRHRRWLGRAGRVFRLAWGFVQRSVTRRVKRVSAIGLSFEAGASRHRGGS